MTLSKDNLFLSCHDYTHRIGPLYIDCHVTWKGSSSVKEEMLKSGIADHLWREKGNPQPLWNEVMIIQNNTRR